jgi:hypothetical protein
MVAVFTRNGYGRALQLDPLAGDSFVPPPGLTPRECREGALRMGINIVVNCLRSRGQTVPDQPARAQVDDPTLRYRYRGAALPVMAEVVRHEGWEQVDSGAPVRVDARPGRLVLRIGASEIDWAGASRACPPGLAASRAVVMDVTSLFPTAARLSIRVRAEGGELYESLPLYVRTGMNEGLRIPLDGTDLRSSTTGWKAYDAQLDRSKRFVSMSVIITGRDIAGEVRISRFRLEGW